MSELAMFKMWLSHLSSLFNLENSRAYTTFFEAHGLVTGVRKFFIPARGYLGWAPLQTAVGDVVVVLPGGRVPYFVREMELNLEASPLGDEGNSKATPQRPTYRFLSDAYLQGFMDGERYDEEKTVDITLV
jgi:hypothetical protein